MPSNFPFRKPVILLMALHACLTLSAQKHQFSFYPIPAYQYQTEGLVARYGSHFFLMGPEVGKELSLLVFDTVTKKSITRFYPFPRTVLSVDSMGNGLRLITTEIRRNGRVCHFMDLDETGNIIGRKETLLQGWRGNIQFLYSPNRKHLLYYQFITVSEDSSLIRGAIMDTGGRITKDLSYPFRMHASLDAVPEVFLDDQGNTHVLVYDKFDNYRISTNAWVNTIPFLQDEIESAGYVFGKVKLRNMRVFQNRELDCLQAEGMYTDGNDKKNKGIYVIRFPAGKNNALSQRFIPFHQEMTKKLKQGFSATEQMILNGLTLLDVKYEAKGSLALLNLQVGDPQKIMQLKPENDPSVSSFNKSLNNSRASDILLPVATTATSTQSRNRLQAGFSDKYVNTLPLSGRTHSLLSPLASRSTSRNAPKLICIKLDSEKGFAWYLTKSLDVFIQERDYYNQVISIKVSDSEMAFVLFQADAAEEPYPVWVSFKNGAQQTEKIPGKMLVLSPIISVSGQGFACLYQDTVNGETGLMLVK